MLAAIVFTDVVGFSARMEDDETATLALLERDFAMMRKLCEKHEGSVLKTTGDGLLLYFSSAVLAVAYAQKMQRYFAETAKAQPGEDALVHRVGIHLGDVFVNNDDVMGDGVNIAARLQAVAEPGGICISQTVYDVVKNKLELEAVKLGTRELKNISDPMPIYRILLEPQKPVGPVSGTAARAFPEPAAPPPFTLTGTQKMAAVLLLIVVLVVVAGLVVQAQRKHEEDLARSKATQAAVGALLGKKTGSPDPGPVDPAATDGKGATNPTSLAEYNFVEMTRSQPAEKTGIGREDPLIRQQANERMQALLRWMDAAMPRYTKDSPLLVREQPGTILNETKIFAGADRKIYFAEGGAIRQRYWTDLKPAGLGAVITSILLDAPARPPREVIQGAEAFAYLYGLPEVNETLRAGHLGSAKK
jgi:class 3 adenylate cyclase